MNNIRYLLAGLLALLLAVPLMAATPVDHHPLNLAAVIVLVVSALALIVFGTVTVTYQWPVVGTVAPTIVQMKPLSLVTGTIGFSADADTIALITHNMNLGNVNLPTNNASLVNETACLFPLVGWYYVTGGSNTTILSGSIVSSQVFAITKLNAASSLGTVNFFVMRPWTGIR